MAYIRLLASGNFRADVRMKGILKNKTFPSEPLAQAWAEKIELSIKTIPDMDNAQLLALSEDDIETMGGETMFKQLGVDLGAIKNAARLEAINALSKKELLQLTPLDIERMGGAELFIQAGKRIRYKTFRPASDGFRPERFQSIPGLKSCLHRHSECLRRPRHAPSPGSDPARGSALRLQMLHGVSRVLQVFFKNPPDTTPIGG